MKLGIASLFLTLPLLTFSPGASALECVKSIGPTYGRFSRVQLGDPSLWQKATTACGKIDLTGAFPAGAKNLGPYFCPFEANAYRGYCHFQTTTACPAKKLFYDPKHLPGVDCTKAIRKKPVSKGTGAPTPLVEEPDDASEH